MEMNQKVKCASVTFAICAGVLAGNISVPTYAAQTKVSYVPGIILVPEVLQSDGQTVRTYQTPKGLSYWTDDLPVQQGDKLKMNVFAVTGGADLKEAKVRVDNVTVADLTSVPWNTLIDTANLTPGYHLVEVWAQATGDRPQTSTKTFSFYVTKTLAASYRVKGSTEVLDSGLTPNLPTNAEQNNAIPAGLPSFLQGRETSSDAGIAVHSDTQEINTQLAAGGTPITVDQPTVFYVRSLPGSSAVKYAYVLARDGQTIIASAAPASLAYQRIRIQGRTDTRPGLRSGTVMLWVWGIDQAGNLSAPVKSQIIIP